jgi:hypothetical protein
MMAESLSSSPTVESAATEKRQLKMDVLVGYILLGGVLLSMALIIAGLLMEIHSDGRCPARV